MRTRLSPPTRESRRKEPGFSLLFIAALLLLSEHSNTAQELREVRQFGLGSLNTVEFSPDGTLVALAGADGVYLRSTEDGRILQHLRPPSSGSIQTVAFSPNGNKLAAGSRLGRVYCWDLRSGQATGSFSPNSAGNSLRRRSEVGNYRPRFLDIGIMEVRFLSNNNHIIAADAFGGIALWNPDTGATAYHKPHASPIHTMEVSADDKVYARFADNSSQFFDGKTGEELQDGIYDLVPDNLHDVSFSSDGNLMVGAPSGGGPTIYNFATSSRTVRGLGPINHALFSPDDTKVLVAAGDQLWLLDAFNGKTQWTVEDDVAFLTRPSFSPDGSMIVYLSESNDRYVVLQADTGRTRSTFSTGVLEIEGLDSGHIINVLDDRGAVLVGSSAKGITRWNYLRNHAEWTIMEHAEPIDFMAVIPDSNRFVTMGASVYSDGVARVWDIETATVIRSFAVPLSFSGAISPDGSTLYSPDWGSVLAHDLESEETNPKSLGEHRNSIWSMALSSDGRFLLTGSDDKTAKVWDTQTGAMVSQNTRHTRNVRAVAYSPASNTVASGSEDGHIMVWDPRSGVVHWEELTSSSLASLAISDNGQWLAAGDSRGLIRVWDLETGSLERSIQQSSNLWSPFWVRTLRFQPNSGQLLAAGSGNPNLLLFDPEVSNVSLDEESVDASIRSIAFTGDGSRFLAADHGGVTRLWEIIPSGPKLTYSFNPGSQSLSVGWETLPNPAQWTLESASQFGGPWQEISSQLDRTHTHEVSLESPANAQAFFRLSNRADP